MHRLLYASAAAVLVLGLAGGLLIYATAPEPDAAQLMEERAALSKTYVRQVREFGGRAAVLFDELTREFAGLWRGKQLGVTLAWLGLAAALVLYLIGRRIEADARKQDAPRHAETP